MEGVDIPQIIHQLNNLIKKYDTGWINRSDWTNVHMGSDTTKDVDSNVTHSLDGTLDELLIKVLVSTDGTDANSFEILNTSVRWSDPGADEPHGIMNYYVDNNNVTIQTGANGVSYLTTSGTFTLIDVEDWYYKIVVYKITV